MIGAVVLFVGLTKLAEKAENQKQTSLGKEVQ